MDHKEKKREKGGLLDVDLLQKMTQIFGREKKRYTGRYNPTMGTVGHTNTKTEHYQRINVGTAFPDLDRYGQPIRPVDQRMRRMDRRRAEEALEKSKRVPIISTNGIRASVFVLMLTVLTVVGIVCLVSRAAELGNLNTNANRLAKSIKSKKVGVTVRQQERDEKQSSFELTLEAETNLMARNMKTVTLYVPANAENGPLMVTNGLSTGQLATIGK